MGTAIALEYLSHEQNMRRAFAANVGPGYWEANPEEQEELIRIRMQRPTPPWSYARQRPAAGPADSRRIGPVSARRRPPALH